MPFPNYENLAENGNQISLKTDYTAPEGGGWLRISVIGITEHCCALDINDKHIGLYNNANGSWNGQTFILPIPPTAHFYVNFPSNASAWFDGHDGDQKFTNLSTYVEQMAAMVPIAEQNCEDAWDEANQIIEYYNDWGYDTDQQYYQGYYERTAAYADKVINLSATAYRWLQELPILSPQYNQCQDYFEDISTYASSASTAKSETYNIYINWTPIE